MVRVLEGVFRGYMSHSTYRYHLQMAGDIDEWLDTHSQGRWVLVNLEDISSTRRLQDENHPSLSLIQHFL